VTPFPTGSAQYVTPELSALCVGLPDIVRWNTGTTNCDVPLMMLVNGRSIAFTDKFLYTRSGLPAGRLDRPDDGGH
jgi:hypothetical protein